MTALAAIHVGLKQLGIVEDDARDLYERMTAKRSLREMTPREQEAVVGELRRLGFRSTGARPGSKGPSKGARKRLEGRFAAKLQALWIAAWNLGIVGNRDDQALLTFVRRQTGIDHVRFLRHPEDAARAIEALKGWMAREGRVVWSDDLVPQWLRQPGAKIASAQWAILVSHGEADADFDKPRPSVADHAFRPLGEMTAAEWRGVMNTLGERVRAAKQAGGRRS